MLISTIFVNLLLKHNNYMNNIYDNNHMKQNINKILKKNVCASGLQFYQRIIYNVKYYLYGINNTYFTLSNN